MRSGLVRGKYSNYGQAAESDFAKREAEQQKR